jgi:glycosyltransferase involved in cell wall biosynthesis
VADDQTDFVRKGRVGAAAGGTVKIAEISERPWQPLNSAKTGNAAGVCGPRCGTWQMWRHPAVGTGGNPMSARLLILIVAYNHEKKIKEVLDRIPEELNVYDIEILVIDDGSHDKTFGNSMAVAANGDYAFKLTVLRNPINQGYGGNQKIGYQYAILNAFDAVALVHGDGQYAPEKLPELAKPVLDGEADAVFGSRMLLKGGALAGGMPLYKFLGNKILSWYQNAVLGTKLSEFHSGYRVYSVSALTGIPFHLNTNDFHFDTEIIIQLLLAGKTIQEHPIPTYYGDEISSVNGLKYAKDVVVATTAVPLQKMGFFYQKKFEVTDLERLSSPYQPKLDFDSSHRRAVDGVAAGARVLDVGCGEGAVARALKDKNCTVTGIDSLPAELVQGVDAYHAIEIGAEPLPVDVSEYDTVLLLDSIEHLMSPEAFADELYRSLGRAPETSVIATTGNVAFFPVRVALLLGRLNYGRRGILDLDHKRLFTFSSFRALFEQRGFDVMETAGIPAPFALAIGNNRVAGLLSWTNKLLIGLSRGLFSYQIYLRLKPRPSLDWLLREAEREAEAQTGAINK